MPVLLIAGTLIFALLLGAGTLLRLYVDWLWFNSLGYQAVFLTILQSRVALFFAGALLFLAFFLPNVQLARRLAKRFVQRVPLRVLSGRESQLGLGPFADLELPAETPFPERLAGDAVRVAGVILSVPMGLAAAGSWEQVLRAWHGLPFGVADPLFGRDAAFYIFTLPVLRFVQGWLVWAGVLTLVGVLALYALSMWTVDPSWEHTLFLLQTRGRTLRAHAFGLAAALGLLFAWGIWMQTYDLLYARHDLFAGASFTDTFVRLPAQRTLAAVTVLVAAALLATVFRRNYRLLLGAGALWAAALVIGLGVAPGVVQRFQVEPGELGFEQPFLEHNIAFTRRAYGLEGAVERTFPAEEAVRPDELRATPQTVLNIRLWDHRPLKDTYNQIQSIRLYYEFPDIDVDRYTIGGVYRQVMLSARELALDRLQQQAQTWVNQRLQFTHGYGLVMSPVNEISPEGLPNLLLKDVPPSGALRVDRPEIYFGAKTNWYVVVNTGVQEFDYPQGDQNVFSTYQARTGISVGSLWRKLVLAWHLGDPNLFFSGYVKPESQVLIRRQIQERVRTLAPFLKIDRDPYIVAADGKLFWLVDAYTTTPHYPYSRAVSERLTAEPAEVPAPTTGPGAPARRPVVGGRRLAYNYIRNSVKIAIDAYDGSVTFYIADPDDPIVRTYEAIFPSLFQPLSDMPASLRAHVRYPEDLFRVQAELYRTYHMTEPRVFYNREDVWEVAMENFGDRKQQVEPYYVIMRLPGESTEEFLLMLPFTPSSKDNMIGWMAARSDGEHYGKLLVFKFPKDRLVFGPMQIEARVDQQPDISAQISLWNQRGSRVVRGNLLVIPIGNSNLYVEPLYLVSEQGQIPELKRVIVANGNQLFMEPTLEAALARHFGPEVVAAVLPGAAASVAASGAAVAAPPGTAVSVAAPPPASPLALDVTAAALVARKRYESALEAVRGGDWSRFGEELRALETALSDLERAATR